MIDLKEDAKYATDHSQGWLFELWLSLHRKDINYFRVAADFDTLQNGKIFAYGTEWRPVCVFEDRGNAITAWGYVRMWEKK